MNRASLGFRVQARVCLFPFCLSPTHGTRGMNQRHTASLRALGKSVRPKAEKTIPRTGQTHSPQLCTNQRTLRQALTVYGCLVRAGQTPCRLENRVLDQTVGQGRHPHRISGIIGSSATCFVNKVLLILSPDHSIAYGLGLLLCSRAE